MDHGVEAILAAALAVLDVRTHLSSSTVHYVEYQQRI